MTKQFVTSIVITFLTFTTVLVTIGFFSVCSERDNIQKKYDDKSQQYDKMIEYHGDNWQKVCYHYGEHICENAHSLPEVTDQMLYERYKKDISN